MEAGTQGSGAFVRPSETEPPAATPPALAEGSMGPGLCIDTEYLGPPSGLSISHPPPPNPLSLQRSQVTTPSCEHSWLPALPFLTLSRRSPIPETVPAPSGSNIRNPHISTFFVTGPLLAPLEPGPRRP